MDVGPRCHGAHGGPRAGGGAPGGMDGGSVTPRDGGRMTMRGRRCSPVAAETGANHRHYDWGKKGGGSCLPDRSVGTLTFPRRQNETGLLGKGGLS